MNASVKVLLVLVLIAVGFLVGYSFSVGETVETVVDNPVYSGSGVFYLFPKRCVECDPQVDDCGDCYTYYSPDFISGVSRDLGVEVKWYSSALVDRASIFVAGEREVGLGVVENKFSMANTICRIAKVEKSCNLVGEELGRVESCLGKEDISRYTLIYHYTSGECSYCDDTTLTVDQLMRDTDYEVLKVDHSNKDEMRVINNCLSSFSAGSYVPEIICPANGFSLVGRVASFNELEEFAKTCSKVE